MNVLNSFGLRTLVHSQRLGCAAPVAEDQDDALTCPQWIAARTCSEAELCGEGQYTKQGESVGRKVLAQRRVGVRRFPAPRAPGRTFPE
jgi:hypothetical protein